MTTVAQLRVPPSAFDIVALGASLGGVLALCELLHALPASFPCAVLVVQHRAARSSPLAEVFARRSSLPVVEGADGEPIRAGTVVLAPAGRHMRVTAEHTIELCDDGRVQFARPSIDVLFRSVAQVYGARAIGVVLTGRQRDGADGTREIKTRGGLVLAQDEASSTAFDMPRASIATGCVDFVLPLRSIASALVAFTMVHGAAALFRVPSPSWADLGRIPKS